MPYAGASLRRREDRRLLTGASQFLDDIRLPGMLHAAVVRSPHAHARVARVDAAEARTFPGVVAVLTAHDLPSPMPRIPAVPMFPGVAAVTHPLLADGTVRYVGQPVAVVVAGSRYAAEDAADAVRVEYDPLPAVVDVDGAAAPDSPVLHVPLGTNVVFTRDIRGGDPETAFREAAKIVEAAFEQPRLAAMPLECRGVVASYDGGTRRFEIRLSTQAPHGARAALAQVLAVAPEQVRVLVPDVGGGFGAKGMVYPEEGLAAYLARSLGRPVAWAEDRIENLKTMTHGRGQRARLRAAAAADGTVVAVDGDLLVDLGAYCYSVTAVIPNLTLLVGLGAYRIPNVHFRLRGVATTKAPSGPYRGAGRPEGAYYIERLMDLVAARLHLDPAEVRRRNFIRTFPHAGATGLVYDSGNYPALLERALGLAEYDRWRREQSQRRARGRRPLGIGLSTWIETAGGDELWETALVRVDPSGGVTAVTGSSPHGQGLATALSQIVADALGLAPEEIVVRHGDTDALPAGIGTFASRSLSIGGSAMAKAAGEVRDTLVDVAARLLEAAPRDVVLADGRASVRGVPSRAVSFAEIVRAGGPVQATVRFTAERVMTPSGAHVAVVEVDPATGAIAVVSYVAVDDCGRVMNPMLAEGQVHGSLAQGFGQALFERVVYSDEGQPLTGSLLDYAAPTAADLGPIVSDMIATPSPLNPLGAKGIGESGTIGAPPALVNAVLDALRPLGVESIDMPLTPDRVWEAICSATQSPLAHPGGWDLACVDVPFEDRRLKASLYGPRDNIVLLLHGAGRSSAGGITPLREDLARRGCGSLAFDHTGHGRTGGELIGTTLSRRIAEAVRAVTFIGLREPLGIVGMSMGGYVAIKLLEHFSVAGLVLIAPAVYSRAALDVPFGPRFSEVIRRHESWRETDAWKLLNRYRGSLLVIAGDGDSVIPRPVIHGCYDEAGAASSRELVALSGVDHFVLSRLRDSNDRRLFEVLDRMAACLRPNGGTLSATSL